MMFVLLAANANVTFNKEKINGNFNNYVDMFIDKELIKVYEKVNIGEVAVCLNDDQVFEAISFVNDINTSKGKHVDYVTNQITKKLSEFITKKKKLTIKPQFIKDNLGVFIKVAIDNPSFNDQTKEFMTLKQRQVWFRMYYH